MMESCLPLNRKARSVVTIGIRAYFELSMIRKCRFAQQTFSGQTTHYMMRFNRCIERLASKSELLWVSTSFLGVVVIHVTMSLNRMTFFASCPSHHIFSSAGIFTPIFISIMALGKWWPCLQSETIRWKQLLSLLQF
ncbi:hypothetical protein EJ04DRAFT_267392 [Polyplosphaeria fusca]|uniref:Uncharacterized protein n=1 Tax=Polyplosphaeria fusca TaxID=682080 RepID=A0A9P4QZB0_9PLEO|nr:hypothetical protein EJ04DRAFT_267392 [Polyplosphaeria fusca]